MLEKKEPSTLSFFQSTARISKHSAIKVWNIGYHSCPNSSLLFNSLTDQLLGFGTNPYIAERTKRGQALQWDIPLKNKHVKQIAAGRTHILVLYEDGSLESFGQGDRGQLGVGCFRRDTESQWIDIQLPNDEYPIYIAASENHNLVISNNHKVYGFGSNHSHCLGPLPSICEFPTPIDLAPHLKPIRVFTGEQRTIIQCEAGELLGLGANYNNEFNLNIRDKIIKKPLQLTQFELLKPVEFILSDELVILVTAENEYYFYGYDISQNLPCDWKVPHKIVFPAHIKPAQVSICNTHLICITDNGELWSTMAGKKTFKPVTLPDLRQAKFVCCSSDVSFILAENKECFMLSEKNPFRPKWEDRELSLQGVYISSTINHQKNQAPLRKPKNPASLFNRLSCTDQTSLIQVIEQDNEQVIEINRPCAYDLRQCLAMLYAFYAKDAPAQATAFAHRHIMTTTPQLMEKHGGKYSVLFIDLSTLGSVRDQYEFRHELASIIVKLYMYYREPLFRGLLADEQYCYKKDHYQEFILEPWYANLESKLEELISLLYDFYQTPIKILIYNADVAYQNDLGLDCQKHLDELFNNLLNRIEGKTSKTVISKVILMGMHPSNLCFDNKKKMHRIHDLCSLESPYSIYFTASPNELSIPENHFLYKIRITMPELQQVKLLLTGDLDIGRDHTALQKHSLLATLLQLGVVQLINEGQSTIFLRLSNDGARNIMQDLYKKWETQALNRITVVLDIDHVLACPGPADQKSALFFCRKGCIVTICNATHYLPPGVIEFTQALFGHPLLKTAYCSSGNPDRNMQFVKEILFKAFNADLAPGIFEKTTILNHLRPAEHQSIREQMQRFGIKDYENKKKDISLAVRIEDNFSHALIIDNNPGMVYFNQEDHYLHTPTVQVADFAQLANDSEPCHGPEDVLFQKVNAIFYIAGVVDYLLEIKNQKSITKELFSLQFTDNNDGTYKTNFAVPKKNMEFYKRGLTWLQQYNRSLTFITKDMYAKSIGTEASELENAEVREALAHEYDNTSCNLM